MSKFVVLLFCLALIAGNLEASLVGKNYYPKKFQDEYRHLDDESLKRELFKILDGLHLQQENKADEIVSDCPESAECYSQARHISYKRARELLFGKLHLKESTGGVYVEDVYCHQRVGPKDGAGVGKIPNHQIQNCEHTWPQSLFNRRFDINLQKTDLHHLFPVDSRANSSRSNNPYGNVNGQDVHENCAASQKGVILGTNTKGFEPPDSHKGNVARALFYFSIRFKSPLNAEYEERLRRWSALDPVDEFERERNEMIYEIQATRNPFIDEPELVDLIADF